MATENHPKAPCGVTRRDLIKGVGGGAAGLALTRAGEAQSAKVPGIEGAQAASEGTPPGEPDNQGLQPTLDDVDQVLGFISPTQAIPFKVPKR